MPKLLFDPIAYQFYYRCREEDGAPAVAAGFGWDPIRRRYYTEDPMVALVLASRGDSYVKLLLADALEATTSHKHLERARRSSKWMPGTNGISIQSGLLH
jgi:hypothetical protein